MIDQWWDVPRWYDEEFYIYYYSNVDPSILIPPVLVLKVISSSTVTGSSQSESLYIFG